MVRTGRRNPPATTFAGTRRPARASRVDPAAARQPPQARLVRIREERAPEWAGQDARAIARGNTTARAAPRDPEARHREHAPQHRPRPNARARDAVADVGLYRAVSYTDLSDQHFDGHPYATRRSVNHMIRAGLIEEHEATGPEGNGRFTVLTATERGRDAAQRAAVDAGHVPEQQTWSGMVKPAELSHDTAVYRAALDERARIEAEGGRVTRVRLDAELKQIVATATEKARAEGGDRAAHEAKLAAAHDLGLHVVNHDHVLYPDAQLDIEDADGVSGRVNVEIVSDHYHAAAIAAKAGSRLCPARQQPIRHPEDRPRAGARNRRRTRRRTLAARPRRIGGAVGRCNPSLSPSG